MLCLASNPIPIALQIKFHLSVLFHYAPNAQPLPTPSLFFSPAIFAPAVTSLSHIIRGLDGVFRNRMAARNLRKPKPIIKMSKPTATTVPGKCYGTEHSFSG